MREKKRRAIRKAQVWIYARDPESRLWKVLILLTQPLRGEKWQPVTGAVEEGESVSEGALREAREETGLEFRSRVLALGRPFKFVKNGFEIIEQGFALEAASRNSTLPDVHMDSSEHQDFRWVSPEEALKVIPFSFQATLLRMLAEKLKSRSRSL